MFKHPISKLILASSLALASLSSLQAAEIEQRKGVVTPPSEPKAPDQNGINDLVLGSVRIPGDVAKSMNSTELANLVKKEITAPKTVTEQIMNEEVIIPIVFFGSLCLVSYFIVHFSYRKKKEMLETVRTAIQSGQTLPGSFMDAMEAKRKPSPDGDLRKAVLLIALGLSSCAVLGFAIEGTGRSWSAGLVPTFLGVGYLFLWRQSLKREKTGSTDVHG